MAEVLAFPKDRIGAGRRGGHAVLFETFANCRHREESVFWLKENAELLNILQCTAARAQCPDLAGALAPFAPFYETVERRMAFFRQYYRFILSICLDLEDLGFAQSKGEALAHWVRAQDLPGGELSDLQRAEARRLLARRGVRLDLPGLDARLRAFIDSPEGFALPNKKIGYELTHIVFYLSDYGQKDPDLSQAALRSLEYVGLVSFLDQDADLLAEVCIALRYAGGEVPVIWQEWLARQTAGFAVTENGFAGQPDDYHCYFVCNWWQDIAGGQAFARGLPEGGTHLRQPGGAGVLHSLSRALYDAVPGQAADWGRVRQDLDAWLNPQQQRIMALAEGSSRDFGAFYDLFARSGQAGVMQTGCA